MQQLINICNFDIGDYLQDSPGIVLPINSGNLNLRAKNTNVSVMRFVFVMQLYLPSQRFLLFLRKSQDRPDISLLLPGFTLIL